MPGRDFFARMRPEFAQYEGSARENANRQAHVERLIATAEYEFGKARRELLAVLVLAEAPPPAIEPARVDAAAEPRQTARAA